MLWHQTCSTYKKPLEREKRHHAVCDITALNKTSKNSGAALGDPRSIQFT